MDLIAPHWCASTNRASLFLRGKKAIHTTKVRKWSEPIVTIRNCLSEFYIQFEVLKKKLVYLFI